MSQRGPRPWAWRVPWRAASHRPHRRDATRVAAAKGLRFLKVCLYTNLADLGVSPEHADTYASAQGDRSYDSDSTQLWYYVQLRR